jgi:hypothetical protein
MSETEFGTCPHCKNGVFKPMTGRAHKCRTCKGRGTLPKAESERLWALRQEGDKAFRERMAEDAADFKRSFGFALPGQKENE